MSIPPSQSATRIVGLDSHPVSLLTTPKRTKGRKPSDDNTDDCKRWFNALTAQGVVFVLPAQLRYLPITTEAMRKAADLWAQIRRAGQPTADRHALDADVILVAQILTLPDVADGNAPVTVATSNAEHITRFIPAGAWEGIIV